MKLKSLHIFGFGRFENRLIDFESEDIQVILGENESGKSTLMAFVEYMLFGFPKKSEKRLRYEPKTTQAYGGRLKIETERYGMLTIERTGGASGTVQLFNEDGSTADEQLLNQVLAEVNHMIFRNIFCFNLDGLQKVNEIKADQLGEYLFNAGLTGAQQLNTISDRLEDEQNKLFKPNGKNPLLNQKLEKLVELDQQVKQWSSKLDEYSAQKETLDVKKEELSELEQERSRWQTAASKQQHFLSIHPLLEKKRTIETQLDELPNATPFPEEGLKRLKMAKERMLELEGEVQHLEDLILQTEQTKDQLDLDTERLAQASELNELERSYHLFQGRQSDYDKLNEQISHLESEIVEEKDAVGTGWTEEQVRSANTDLVSKQQLTTILKKLDRLESEQKRLDHDLEHSRVQLEENEDKLARLKSRLVEKEKVEAYKERLKRLTSHSPSQIKEQLSRLQQMQKSDNPYPIPKMMIWMLIGLGIILAAFWIMNGDLITGLIIGIALSGTGVILNSRGNGTDRKFIEEEIKQLERQLSNQDYDENEKEKLEKILMEQQQFTIQKAHLEEQTIDLEKQYQRVARLYDQWELDDIQVKEELHSWRQTFNMPDHVPNDMMLELFDRIDRLKRRVMELEKLKSRRVQFQNEMDRLMSKLQRLSQNTISDRHDLDREMNRLVSELKQELEKQEQLKHLEKEQEDLLKRMEGFQKKASQYENEMKKLFATAEVNDEETFWSKGKANEKFNNLMEQLQLVNAQLEHSITEETVDELMDIKQTFEQTKERLNELNHQIEQADGRIDGLRDECATLQANITHLEEDGSYSNQLHALEMAKSEFNEQAKQWAIYRTAQHALNVAKQNYQAERQPRVMRRAENYLDKLTEGRYTRLIAPKGEESFLIERNDSILFRPEELSRATMEQLYLALRFALAGEYENSGAFPLIMDDILVNFDQKRRILASELIQTIAKERQVLYFTCHETTAEPLSTESIRLPSPNTMQPQTF
ncbi:AAA family ATPase [Pseudalkalibacillus sp. Hm43]|uniref:ATP-binding protein n=1 Tax=Pseudalkalibacillus sp. Hm43 TaxID=3450742 RepID=UPI003F435ECD